ncbi:MAG: alpha/beta hydrolase [Myxococcales bacterium]|nr:alpha/beta hydrolase [Myxococcales bacterium]
MATTWTREDVTFLSDDARCAAWLYRPAGAGTRPCVVLGHGFGGVREMRLDAYAERFVTAGYVALAFDYRSFGASQGEPRQWLDVRRQLADWRAAVACARALPGVDAERVVLWGTSFGGGHVLVTAAGDARIAAVVAQVPHTSGLAAATSASLGQTLWLAREALRDLVGARLGRPPRYVPLAGPPGSHAAITAPGAVEWVRRATPPGWQGREDVAARVFLSVPTYSPGRAAARIRCPVLVIVAERDRLAPPGPAEAAARRAPRGELRRHSVDHFDIYFDEPFERAVADELEFLGRHVPPLASA